MTKTVCDICGCESNNQYTIPIWSNFDTNGIMRNVPNYAKIQTVKIDLCEKHEKKIANFIIKLIGDEHKELKFREKESYNVL